MFKTYQVGTIYGIPFKVDVTFLLILPVFVWAIAGQVGDVVGIFNRNLGVALAADPLTAGTTPWLLGTAAALSLFVCVLLHELGHAAVAMAYDYEIESITLWLLGGLAKPAELPSDWRHEFWIAVAGPAVNVAIAAGCGVAMLVAPSADVVVFLLLYIAVLNVSLAVFNMRPAFPLDGGRVLRALLGRSQSYVRATRQAASVGKGMAVLLGIGGLLMADLILVAIALFVYIAANSETRQMMLDAAFEGVEITEVMTPTEELTTVEADMPVEDFLDVMLDDRHISYPVLAEGEFVGIVTLSDVQSTETADLPVRQVMTPVEEVETVPITCEVMDAFEALSRNDVGRLPIVEGDRLRGLMTRTDLMRSFKIAMEQQRFEDDQVETLGSQTRRSGRYG